MGSDTNVIQPPLQSRQARSQQTSKAEREKEKASSLFTSAPRQKYDSALARWATTAGFLLPDLLTFGVVAFGLEEVARLGELPDVTAHLGLIAVLLFAALASGGLYHRAFSMHPVRELRRASLITVGVIWAYSAAVAFVGSSSLALSLELAVAGGILALLLPAARGFARVLLSNADWWGAQALVIASNDGAGGAVVRDLKRWPELGLQPVAILQADAGDSLPEVGGVPVLGDLDLTSYLLSNYHIPYVIVALPNTERRNLVGVLRQCSRSCRQVLVIAGVSTVSALWTTRQAFEGFLGYSIQHDGPSRIPQRLKRAIDIAGAFCALLVLAPALGVLAALIKWNSDGPVFYRQCRVGRDGHRFEVLKFRSMYPNAEQRLETMLQQNADRCAEYEKYHKLKDDPRVTSLGRWLRRYSLDELPQLWNVLKGDMSLVGPRAYKPDELPKMNGFENVILESRPGLSGLWQVSGRNTLSFAERTRLDVHYVHNWSLWLDLYILVRSVPVVLTGNGAA